MDLTGLLLLAEGRGDSPSVLGGILIVAGILVAVVVLGLVAHALFGGRRTRPRPWIFRRRPHRRGRIGRIGS